MTISRNPFEVARSVPRLSTVSERSTQEVLRQKFLYELIINSAERVTAGNNGIILRLPYNDLPEDQKQQMRSFGLNWDTETAVKILKILDPLQSEREYKIQQVAYDIVSKQENQEDFAKVPKPLFHGYIPLDGDKREILSEKVDFKFLHTGAQIIAMDFIEGDDLATVTNREVLKYLYEHLIQRKEVAPLIRSFKDTWQLKDYNELQKTIQELFRTIKGFNYRMTGLSTDSFMRYPSEGTTSEETLKRVYTANAKAKLELLKAAEFSFNPLIPKKIVKTIRLLKDKGIVMTDSHQRNFMVNGDIEGDGDVEAYVIDYGNAYLEGNLASDYGVKPAEDVGAGILDTENVVNWLVSIQRAAGRAARVKRWNE